ncbi:hypothetical protein Drorol1_Dr00027557 [Drosera rotundifolia]
MNGSHSPSGSQLQPNEMSKPKIPKRTLYFPYSQIPHILTPQLNPKIEYVQKPPNLNEIPNAHQHRLRTPETNTTKLPFEFASYSLVFPRCCCWNLLMLMEGRSRREGPREINRESSNQEHIEPRTSTHPPHTPDVTPSPPKTRYRRYLFRLTTLPCPPSLPDSSSSPPRSVGPALSCEICEEPQPLVLSVSVEAAATPPSPHVLQTRRRPSRSRAVVSCFPVKADLAAPSPSSQPVAPQIQQRRRLAVHNRSKSCRCHIPVLAPSLSEREASSPGGCAEGLS